MATQKIETSIRITRRISGNPEIDGKFFLSIVDKSSRIGFIEVLLNPEDIANMLAGAAVEHEATVRGLDKVGMKLVRQERSMIVHKDYVDYEKKKLREFITEKEEHGEWSLDLHLGSQRSIHRHEGDYYIARYSRYKYVSVEQNKNEKDEQND